MSVFTFFHSPDLLSCKPTHTDKMGRERGSSLQKSEYWSGEWCAFWLVAIAIVDSA